MYGMSLRYVKTLLFFVIFLAISVSVVKNEMNSIIKQQKNKEILQAIMDSQNEQKALEALQNQKQNNTENIENGNINVVLDDIQDTVSQNTQEEFIEETPKEEELAIEER